MAPQIETVEDMRKFALSRAMGFIYLYLARPAIESWGMEGEKAIRKGLRNFGKHRGKRMRKWHDREGLPINVEALIKCWDILSVEGADAFNPETVMTPYFVEFTGDKCFLYNVCKEADWEHWGYLYCDEMHYECYRAYHPGIIVEIHENLMKGDSGCHFVQLMLPKTPEEQIDKSPLEALLKRFKENPVDFTRLMLQREGNHIANIYYWIATALIEKFGQEGRDMVESALVEMGKKRGQELKERLDRAGLEKTWANIWDNFDLAYKYAWKMKLEETADERSFVAKVEYCPLAEIWAELGDTELGPLYCDHTYGAIFKELNSGAKIKIPKCLSKGDKACRFEFRV